MSTGMSMGTGLSVVVENDANNSVPKDAFNVKAALCNKTKGGK
jgi:hypothetical protein